MKIFNSKKSLAFVLSFVLVISAMFACFTLAASAADTDITIEYAGYIHANHVVLIAGDNKTIGEITIDGIGGEAKKDMNAFAVVIVDANDYVVSVHNVIGREDAAGVKTDLVCPKGGFILGINAYNSEKPEYYNAYKELDIKPGDVVKLKGVSREDIPAKGN
ncbi:hypothetical protein LJB90_04230, partial [Eubacteriales bacterium OttesenSCG-928-G02]|nr:hypothetical protein [Eubacteriales bacterium OttesenSCG-928-G02]